MTTKKTAASYSPEVRERAVRSWCWRLVAITRRSGRATKERGGHHLGISQDRLHGGDFEANFGVHGVRKV